uniref:uncharacterized protein LOC114589410 n=1 Tax=Podarcis muralis TaxID=64176 RepID=UPI0010A03187|nr:uncharacterized protein LOC114589410 [Podarcis muralis]
MTLRPKCLPPSPNGGSLQKPAAPLHARLGGYHEMQPIQQTEGNATRIVETTRRRYTPNNNHDGWHRGQAIQGHLTFCGCIYPYTELAPHPARSQALARRLCGRARGTRRPDGEEEEKKQGRESVPKGRPEDPLSAPFHYFASRAKPSGFPKRPGQATLPLPDGLSHSPPRKWESPTTRVSVDCSGAPWNGWDRERNRIEVKTELFVFPLLPRYLGEGSLGVRATGTSWFEEGKARLIFHRGTPSPHKAIHSPARLGPEILLIYWLLF